MKLQVKIEIDVCAVTNTKNKWSQILEKLVIHSIYGVFHVRDLVLCLLVAIPNFVTLVKMDQRFLYFFFCNIN